MKRRLFSILLALCMTLAMLPTAAFAKSVSYNGEIIIENFGWLFLNNDEVGYYIPGKSERFRSIPPDAGPYLKVTKTGENEITITVFGNVTLQGKKALSANDENAIKSIKNLIITGAADGKNTLSLSTTTRGTAISVLGDLTVTGIALTATAERGYALRANNITVSDATLIATNNSADNAAIQATQGDGPLGNLTVSGASAITITNNNANGRAIHATIINGNTDGRSLTVNGNETPGQTDASQVTISSPAPHSHICSDGWTSDATGHWHRCADANCTEKLNFAAHTGGNATCTAKKKCEICGEPYGELDPNNHTHLSDWIFDETGHWKTCNDCGAIIEEAAHIGGTATCTDAKKCEICGQSYGELNPSNHTALSGWKFDETCHWKTCSACSTDIEKTAHTFDDWIIDKEPTATEAGLKHHTCSVCHYKETAAIPPVPCTHERSTPWEPAGDGVHHVKKCADCGAIIEKAAHIGGAATCNAKKKCEICGQSYGELDPSNHTSLSVWIFDETGHWKVCADCKAADIDKAIHAYSNWILDKEATATETGSRHKACTICNYETQTETIPATGPCTHDGTLKYTDNGDWSTHKVECTACGQVINAKEAHAIHGYRINDVAGTHQEFCNKCSYIGYPLQHTKFIYVADGNSHYKKCGICGVTTGLKEAHTFDNGSCTACGAAAPAPVEPTPGGSGIIITLEATGPVFLSGANQTVALGSAAAFRIDYSYAAFRSVAVDGVILDSANYTTWDGSTWVKLTAAYTKSLTPGTHTLSVYFDGATAATTFTVGGQPNPATGARDAVGIATAAAVIALLGSAALLRKK